MSRVHGRAPRDWVIEASREDYYGFGLPVLTAPVRLTLTMDLSPAEARRLADWLQEEWGRGVPYRRSPRFEYRLTGGLCSAERCRVSGIKITAAEADLIMRGHQDPLDVLCGPWPECGYRLVLVPDRFGAP